MSAQTPFFIRRRILVVVCIVLVGYIGIWATVLIGNKIDHDRKVRTIKAEQAKINKLSKEDRAILNATTYFKQNIATQKTTERLFLDYLQRKFKLDSTLGVAGPPMDLYENPKTYPEDIHFLARIAYPDRLVKVPPKSTPEGPALTNIYSANCDHMTLPKNFWSTMEQDYKTGGYYLTHDALALAFMKDNNCPIPANESDLSLRVTTGMVSILENPNTVPDLRYETLALLMLGGHYDVIKSEWIDQVISDQKPEGSWGEKGKADKSSDHATLLALWALLEYNNPNTPYEPLIHRPASQS